MNKWSTRYFVDLLERAAATFLEVLIPMAVAAENLVALDWRHALIVSGSAAGLALLKGLLANLANPDSGASALPAPPGPEVTPGPLEERGESALTVALTVLVILVIVFVVLSLVR